MSKDKKFERKVNRPSFAASLEAVRQGKTIAVTPKSDQAEVRTRTTATAETAFVKDEMIKIGRVAGVLLALLIVLSLTEARTQVLTRFVSSFIQ